MKFGKFLMVGLLALGSHVHVNAAEIESKNIFSLLESGSANYTQEVKSEAQSLYKKIFSKLTSAGMTTLNESEVPISVDINNNPKSSVNHLKFTAYADTDENEKNSVRVLFNPKGEIATPVTKTTVEFAKKNQNGIHDGNYLEFSILHELAHHQHDKMGYMHSKVSKSMTIDETSFLNQEKEKDYNRSVDGRHQEQTADMLAAIWTLKNNNFSQEAIEVVKSFRDNRAEDLKNMQVSIDKKIISYDTAKGLNFVLDNIEEVKKLNGLEVLDYVSENSSKLTKNYIDSVNNTATVKPLSDTLSSMQKIRQNSVKNQTSISIKNRG